MNTSGSIIVQAFVMTGVASGFSLTNSVSITGIKGDVSSSDNQDSVSLYIYGDPSLGATGSSSSTGDE